MTTPTSETPTPSTPGPFTGVHATGPVPIVTSELHHWANDAHTTGQIAIVSSLRTR